MRRQEEPDARRRAGNESTGIKSRGGSAREPDAGSQRDQNAGSGAGEAAGRKGRRSGRKKDENSGRRINREILVFLYLFLIAFAGFTAYFIWFQQTQSETVVNNPYNSRVDTLVSRTVRGRILSSDGKVLAETVTDSEGNESRVYPYGEETAFVTGYTDMGRTGVESLANYYLLSSHQSIWIKFLNDLQGEKNQGDDVVTTIDMDLQQAAWEAMAGRDGAAVVLEASTGRILAMVSNPSYDPNTIEEDWDWISSDDNTDANLLNRASQGLYAPGSTFKLVTLLEFIREYPDTWQDFTYTCTGVNEEEDYTIRCYGGTAHGEVSVQEALVVSCNGAFAAIGQMLDPEQFTQTCESLLFNQSMPTDIAASTSSFSLASDSNAWTRARTSIGQGQTQITPLLSAMITAAIANDGVMMQPYIIDSLSSGQKTVQTFEPEEYGTVMTEEEADIISTMMRAVITDGSAHSLQTDLYEASGKTGTAEYITGSDSTHAWFTGFAGEGDDCIVISVILEGAGTGSSQAAPVAAAVFDAWFAR